MPQQQMEPQNFYQEQLMDGYEQHFNDPEILEKLHSM